jgi:hypothetical protein
VLWIGILDAHPESDPTFHMMPIHHSYPYPTPSFILFSQQRQFTLLHQRHNVQYFGQYNEIFWEIVLFSFTFGCNGFGSAPDRQGLDADAMYTNIWGQVRPGTPS